MVEALMKNHHQVHYHFPLGPWTQWWLEYFHGVSNVGPKTNSDVTVPRATGFLQAILTVASFHDSLCKVIGWVGIYQTHPSMFSGTNFMLDLDKKLKCLSYMLFIYLY